MRIKRYDSQNFKIWLSASDTYNWAHKPGAMWPCSQLAGRRVFAEFNSNDLCDLTINGKRNDCDAGEFNAIIEDFAKKELQK